MENGSHFVKMRGLFTGGMAWNGKVFDVDDFRMTFSWSCPLSCILKDLTENK